MAKDSYEISLWHDIFVPANGNVPGHYEEEKIAIIGSDKMTSQCRAIEPKLVCNVNGKITFTFKMFYRYTDELTGEDYDNPFLKLLVNERKLKVHWLNDWYDLVIKSIQESSNGKSVVYTCEDANIYELGRTGFDLIFDDDLSVNNIDGGNQGTATELVERTLEGTDWVLGDCDVIRQYTEEAVFEVNVTRNLAAYDMLTEQAVTIPSGAKILIYYPQLANFINATADGSSTTEATFNPFYIAYDESQKYNRLARTEMLVQAKCYMLGSTGNASCTCHVQGNTLTFTTSSIFGQVNINNISDQYRANRLIRQPINKIEPVTGKSCYVYVATNNGTGAYAGKVLKNDVIYEYVGSEFGDALYATNLIANGKSFISTAGWEAPSNSPLSLKVYPSTAASSGSRKVYLNLPPTTTTTRTYYNDAFRANSQHFKDGCKQGEVLRLRIKAKRGENLYCTAESTLTPSVTQWETNVSLGCKQPKNNGKTYFSVGSAVDESSGNWVHFDLTCTESFTASDIYKDYIGLFLTQGTQATFGRWIEEIQLFKVVKDNDGEVILPDELDKTGIIKTTYTYFKVSSDKEIIYLYKGTEDWDKQGVTLEQKYNDGYSKVRAINIKQSNRFNILQTIAETFECWIRIKVDHDLETGKLIYDNGVPRKYVTIKQEMGEERGIGFVYGIDLQSIQRTIDSNQIVTKTIVLENNNKYGKNGTCRISRSSFNYPQVDYILNFDYYVNHKLMDGQELNYDLYGISGTQNDTRGFYANLHKWNSEIIEKAEKNAQYELALTKDEGLLKVYETGLEAAGIEISDNKAWVVNVAATKKAGNVSAYDNSLTQQFIQQYIDTNAELKAHVAAIESQTQLQDYYSQQIQSLTSVIDSYKRTIKQNQDRIDILLGYIKKKTDLFNKKYSRFISEGSWIDQKYYDDNLYYVDGNSVAYTSSRPKVSYNISVLRLTGLEEFKIKDFHLGDISYVEDTDFFGYTYVIHGNEQVKTPYREKVVITEVTYNFDEPKKDTFKVQNYRTQFEDLFQRIAAQTQSLQYTVGAYNKVSDIIETDGTIKGDTIKSSIDLNNDALNRTSLNNLVTTDERGVTVQSLVNPSQAVRVTAGGLFITTNGGDSWNNAIRGDGIGTQFLSSGSINTRNIQIINGDNEFDDSAVAFKWDVDGITAYDSFSSLQSGLAYDKGKYVRFNNEGVSIQTRAGTSTASPTYEKLKMGRLNEQNEYGLRINTFNTQTGAVDTAFAATETGLFVKGNITAASLTLDPSIAIPAGQVKDGNKTIFEVIDGKISSEVSNIAIGGHNVLRGTGNPTKDTGTWSTGTFRASGSAGTFSVVNITDSPVPGITKAFQLAYNGDSSGQLGLAQDAYTMYGHIGEKLTFSVWAKGPKNTQIRIQPYWTNATNESESSSKTITLTKANQWEKISFTSNAIKFDHSRISIGYLYVNYGVSTAATVQFTGLMLEWGTISSDWTPAQEDIDAELISQSTRITQTASDISLAASRITTIENTGTGNLLRNAGTFKDWPKHSTCTTTGIAGSNVAATAIVNGHNYANFSAVSSVSYRAINSPNGDLGIPYELIRNKTITVSWYCYSPDAASLNGTNSASKNILLAVLSLHKVGDTARTRYATVKLFSSAIAEPYKLTTSWKRFSVTLNITDSWFATWDNKSDGAADPGVRPTDIVFLQFYDYSPYRAYFCCPQIELGSTATEWAPMPSENSIAKAEASITINADAITSVMTRTSMLESKGNNLLRNAGTFEGWGKSSDVTLKTAGGTAVGGNIYANFPTTTETPVPWRSIYHNTNNLAIPYSQIRNKTITVSVYVSSDDAAKITGENMNYLLWRLNLRTKSSTAQTKYVSLGSIHYNSSERKLTTGWTRVSRTLEITDSIFRGEGTISSSDYVYLSLVNYSPYSGRFCCPQIEIGNVVTPWSPMVGDNALSYAESEISQQAGQIELKVSSSEYTPDEVLKKVNKSSLIIDPKRISLKGKTIELTSQNITINSDNFSVDKNGKITASSGTIAGWTFSPDMLYKDTVVSNRQYRVRLYSPSTATDTTIGIAAINRDYTNPSSPGDWSWPFYVRYDGYLHSTKGTIGGWMIDPTSIYKNTTIDNNTYQAFIYAPSSPKATSGAFGVSKTDTDGNVTYPFLVRYNGTASLTGSITATSGQIGKYTITSTYLYTGSGSTEAGMGGNQAFWAGGSNSNTAPFHVGYDGAFTATNATITGSITANSLTLGSSVTVPAAKVSGLLSAATIKASSIDVSSGKITADKINGNGLTIADSGTIGPFTIGKEGYIPTLSATNVKLTSIGVYTSNGYFSQIGGYGTAQGANNIKLILSDGTTPTLEAYIKAVALHVIANNVTKTVYRNTNATVQTLYANDGDNRVLYGYIR